MDRKPVRVTDDTDSARTRPTPKRTPFPSRTSLNNFAIWPWKGTFEKWSHAFVHRNYWRVKHVCPSHEDAVQTCALIFSECVSRYGSKVDNPAWLMALYSRSVINHWHRMSLLDQRRREHEWLRADIIGNKDDYGFDDRPDELCFPNEIVPPDASLVDTMLSFPAEIRHVLTVLLQSPGEVLDMLIEGKSEKLDNLAIRRFFGISSEVNILEEIRRGLSGKMSRHIVFSKEP